MVGEVSERGGCVSDMRLEVGRRWGLGVRKNDNIFIMNVCDYLLGVGA